MDGELVLRPIGLSLSLSLSSPGGDCFGGKLSKSLFIEYWDTDDISVWDMLDLGSLEMESDFDALRRIT